MGKLIDKIHKEWLATDFSVPKDTTKEWEYIEITEVINPTQQQVDDFIYNLDNQIYG